VGCWRSPPPSPPLPPPPPPPPPETDIRQFVPDAPPLYATFEVGLIAAVYRDSELGNGSLIRLQLGPALHYRF
jgi:hypothetical protein